MLPEPLLVIKRLAQVFDDQNIPYLIGGSVASSMHGIHRYTQDVDFVADIKEDNVAPLVAELAEEFYIDDEMILDAITTQSSFSVIHLPTMVKADVFIKTSAPWKEAEWARRCLMSLGSDDEKFTVQVASPEDMILQKLVWFRLGGGVSDRQWSDVTGMLKVQANALDLAYMRRWATDLELAELLQKALEDAGQGEISSDAA